MTRSVCGPAVASVRMAWTARSPDSYWCSSRPWPRRRSGSAGVSMRSCVALMGVRSWGVCGGGMLEDGGAEIKDHVSAGGGRIAHQAAKERIDAKTNRAHEDEHTEG